MNTPLHEVASNLWVLGYPFKMMGADLRRNTSIIRLPSGKLVIHSTAAFSPGDVEAICALGEPGWLVDSLLRHDTFAKEGREAFPNIPYLAPEGFSKDLDFETVPMIPPDEWGLDLQVVPIEGAPSLSEHVFYHPESRSIIVADLVLNFGSEENLWTEVLLKIAAVAGKHSPGMSRLFKTSVEDTAAFEASVSRLLALDFDRVIVGHGDIIATNGKALLADAIRTAGFAVFEAGEKGW